MLNFFSGCTMHVYDVVISLYSVYWNGGGGGGGGLDSMCTLDPHTYFSVCSMINKFVEDISSSYVRLLWCGVGVYNHRNTCNCVRNRCHALV